MTMGGSGGEPYRWFIDKHGTISMIPLSALQEQIKCQNKRADL